MLDTLLIGKPLATAAPGPAATLMKSVPAGKANRPLTAKPATNDAFQHAIQTAQEFSAMFIDELLQETMPNLFGKAVGGQSYQSLFMQSLSQDMAQSGDAMGLMPMLEKSLHIPASAVKSFESHPLSLPAQAVRSVASEVGSPISADAQSFIQKLAPMVDAAAKALGISPRLILAQAALETGWGQSVVGNNLFGIKATPGAPSVLAATHEADAAGQMVPTQAAFRAFSSIGSCLTHYVDLLKAHYPGVIGAGSNAQQFAQALVNGHYATDPNYARMIVEMTQAPALANVP